MIKQLNVRVILIIKIKMLIVIRIKKIKQIVNKSLK
jgi:hypothetical protein